MSSCVVEEISAPNPLLAVADEVLRLNGRLRSLFRDVGEGSGVSAMSSAVLAAVVQAPVPPTVPQIGRSLGHPRQVIQRAANELVHAGLVTLAANPDHKRAPLLIATENGRRRKHEADVRAAQAAGGVLATVGTERAERLVEALREFRVEVEAHLREREQA